MDGADGTYGFVYSGVAGIGIGGFIVKNGHLNGTDAGGSRYTGKVTEEPDGSLFIEFDHFVPAGMGLAQGTSPQEADYTKNDLKLRLPPGYGEGIAKTVPLPPGQITIMVRRIPDDWVPYIERGFRLVHL